MRRSVRKSVRVYVCLPALRLVLCLIITKTRLFIIVSYVSSSLRRVFSLLCLASYYYQFITVFTARSGFAGGGAVVVPRSDVSSRFKKGWGLHALAGLFSVTWGSFTGLFRHAYL